MESNKTNEKHFKIIYTFTEINIIQKAKKIIN